MYKTAIIFGGSGYIGTNMILFFLKKQIFDRYIVCDIQPPEEHMGKDEVSYIEVDIRNPIKFKIEAVNVDSSWIFNFAAIHREPGHQEREYFDTNVPGARHVVNFAEENDIKNIFFTSSIAPYGQSNKERTEYSQIYPDTPYGVSKALAEEIHNSWLNEKNERRLIIVRPGVIFGGKDPGNVYVMIRAIRRGTFVLPNSGKIQKAHGYIEGLLESILFTMNKTTSSILYNYAENPSVSLKEMISITKKECNYKRPIFRLSLKLLIGASYFIRIISKLTGRKTKIHPIRVKKAGLSTNIIPQYLIENKFEFKYNYREALKHWRANFPDQF